MKSYLLLVLLSVLAAGCIAPEINKGNPAEYELPGLINTTIIYLNLSSVQVVDSVVNTTSDGFFIESSDEMSFVDPVAVDYSGNNVSFNVSEELILGRNFARFNFSSLFSGFVAFSQPGSQDFTYLLTKNGTVRVVLPANYTERSFIGIAEPKPDNITLDSSGREVIIWNNPYPETGIRVKYLDKNAPALLFYFFFSLFIFAILVLGYYYMSLSALKKKRAMMEKNIRK
ncbi:MAG: DUF5803 family protein [Candidatus Methanoperedens sp.]|nr:DUF5803 family protein [Candidatus Methanoperedens sp.]MCZ7395192.1 DUF5803 family protein [Candidatus Methanoperedens sp.]